MKFADLTDPQQTGFRLTVLLIAGAAFGGCGFLGTLARGFSPGLACAAFGAVAGFCGGLLYCAIRLQQEG